MQIFIESLNNQQTHFSRVPIKLKYDRKYWHLGSGNLVSIFELEAAIYVTNSVTVFLLLYCTTCTLYSHVLSHMHGLYTSF